MNTENPLRDAHGRSMFALGHSAFRIFEAGVYTVALDWVQDEPAMVIWTNRVGGASPALAICLSSAGKYANPDGSPNEEGMTVLAESLPDFGREMNREELHFLTSIVLRYMPDLLHMPPQPRAIAEAKKPEPMVELTQKFGDGTVIGEALV